MAADYTYRSDAEGPPMPIHWKDYAGDTIDFSSGWEFALQLVDSAGSVQATLTDQAQFTGAATSPNVIVDWTTNFFDGLDGVYSVHLKATDTVTSQERFFSLSRLPRLEVIPAPSA